MATPFTPDQLACLEARYNNGGEPGGLPWSRVCTYLGRGVTIPGQLASNHLRASGLTAPPPPKSLMGLSGQLSPNL